MNIFTSIIELFLDALKISSVAQREMNLFRRSLIVADTNFNQEYKHLNSTGVLITDHIFDDELPKNVSDICTVDKLRGKMVKRNKSRPYGQNMYVVERFSADGPELSGRVSESQQAVVDSRLRFHVTFTFCSNFGLEIFQSFFY